jgi:hypothetical protein
MTYHTSHHSGLGPVLGIGVFGALLSALAAWGLGSPPSVVIAGYVLGGMIYTVLGALWLSRAHAAPSN